MTNLSSEIQPSLMSQVVVTSNLASHYDDSTYLGRLKKFIDLTSPRHLFYSETDVRQCQQFLATPDPSPTKDVRHCQSMVAACVHPTTKDVIPFFGRMAMFVPINIPICAGMLLAAPTLPNLVGWQWFNQTYNAVFNHSNAAKSGSDEKQTLGFVDQYGDLLKGYSAAVIVSVGLSVGLTQWLKRARMSPTMKSYLQTIVPYTAVASAGVANVGLMRIGELSTGLPVHTPGGHYVGHSKIAAKKALTETAVSRAVLSGPILLLPPPLISLALRWDVLRSNKILKIATELSFVVLGIAVGLPSAIALFPQMAELSLDSLEPELALKAEALMAADEARHVVFNKGV